MNKNLTSKKLKNLIFEFESNFVTVNFQNQTNIVIPPEIPENQGVASPFKNPANILEIDNLVLNFQNTARNENVSELTLARIKSHAAISGLDIHDCTTFNPKVQDFKNFLKNHPDQIFISVDKSSDIMFMNKIDYFSKVNDFLGENFEKIENYDNKNLEIDIENYKNIITDTFKNSLPKEMIRTLHPPSSVSEFFGLIKCHKVNEPIRGICTGYNSLVSNSETFLKKLLQPLVDECQYSINNQINFKTKFLEDKTKFDPKIHRVISVDIVSMYSNVNVPRTISYILDKIFENPEKYFPFKNKQGTPLTPPTREKIKKFQIETFAYASFDAFQFLKNHDEIISSSSMMVYTLFRCI